MNQKSKKPLTDQEFKEVYSKVNRLNIEIIISNSQGFLLTKRDVEPYKGMWHLPGGTVHFREPVEFAVQRIAKAELGVSLKSLKFDSYIEYPSVLKNNGFDQPVGLAFICEPSSLDFILDEQSSDVGFFSPIPENTIPEQKEHLESLNLTSHPSSWA